MQPQRRRPDVFGNRGRECDDVVLGGSLDFLDAFDCERPTLADVARGFLWHDPGAGHRIDRGNFNL
jgi:hypothetical protein